MGNSLDREVFQIRVRTDYNDYVAEGGKVAVLGPDQREKSIGGAEVDTHHKPQNRRASEPLLPYPLDLVPEGNGNVVEEHHCEAYSRVRRLFL